MNNIRLDSIASGVLQGTVLGPLLFSLHIIDIMSDIEFKKRLFADDCLCYPEIMYMEVTLKFQKNATSCS